MKTAPLALAACILLAGASTAFAFTPPQDPDAPAQVVPLAPRATPAQQTQAQTQAPGAAAPRKTRAQVQEELAQAKANGQYTFGELDYPPQTLQPD
ncbi:DUF4148 domain-containing protein [Achromobacter aloeverae]|uniref:DUF4148 domain-containing protein n=2 Tax=Achromobacter aloeverae TaxID=1750518 RepID=A0A4Q1HKY2_9BURK|nr:DUF4148 domain-containing protein [Achromobacter aloeverae]RXN90629.1 hypothetical protein C7R54_12720 [Achromobacter aloeverae]